MATDEHDSAGIKLPPPLYFASGLGLGLLLSHWFATPFGSGMWADLLGSALVAVSLLLGLSAAYALWRAGTTVRPDRPSSALVEAGPYRFTRNPLYVALTLLYLGVALLAQSLWALLLLPVVLLIIQRNVIVREENYLERRFGADYDRYRAQVRRWF